MRPVAPDRKKQTPRMQRSKGFIGKATLFAPHTIITIFTLYRSPKRISYARTKHRADSVDVPKTTLRGRGKRTVNGLERRRWPCRYALLYVLRTDLTRVVRSSGAGWSV